MPEYHEESRGQGSLFPRILRLFTDGGLILILNNLMEAWELVSQLRDRIGYHGMYEILDYNSTLEIQDANGEVATITRREVIRFLQDNVVAIHDHAWGDGDIFAEYRCRPGSCSLSDKRFRILRQTQAQFYCSNSTDKLNRQIDFLGGLCYYVANFPWTFGCRARGRR